MPLPQSAWRVAVMFMAAAMFCALESEMHLVVNPVVTHFGGTCLGSMLVHVDDIIGWCFFLKTEGRFVVRGLLFATRSRWRRFARRSVVSLPGRHFWQKKHNRAKSMHRRPFVGTAFKAALGQNDCWGLICGWT